MQSRIPIVLCLALALVTSLAAAQDPPLQSDDDKMLYTLGTVLSRRLAEYALTPAEAAIVARGLSDGLNRKTPAVDVESHVQQMESYFGDRVRKVADAERLAGDAYREKIGRKKGVVTTGTGLVFQESSPGSGERPAGPDKVRVKLTGKLRDGKVFVDNEGEAVEIATALPCVREGLLRMRSGAAATLICPPELAYGNRGAPPHVLPGATVIYDVELLSVEKGTP